MSSKIEIMSAAVMLLGQDEINSIGENAPPVIKRASALYDIYYPAFLTRYAWRFALKQFTLNKVTVFDEITGYNDAYQLPSDYLAILRTDPANNYRIFGTLLYSNISTNLKLIYTSNINEGVIPVYYIEFLVEKFAEIFAMPITGNPKLLELWGQSAAKKLNRAIALDDQNQPSFVIADNPLIAAKYSSNVLL